MQASENFEFLSEHSAIYLQLMRTAEAVFVSDPNTTLIKIRQLGEALAQDLATRYGINFDKQTTQVELLKRLNSANLLDSNVRNLFHLVRMAGNEAAHEFQTRHREALEALKGARELAVWFHRSFGKQGSAFKAGAFIQPTDPSQQLNALNQQIEQLKAQLQLANQQSSTQQDLAALLKQQQREAQLLEELMTEEAQRYQSIIAAYEQDLVAQEDLFQAELANLRAQLAQKQTEAQQSQRRKELLKKIQLANKQVHLTEEQTRLSIDRQLRDLGWQADSHYIRFDLGVRPEAKTCKAIAEWPTQGGFADYVLFDGLKAVAVIEAKRRHKNAYNALEQAKHYAANFKTQDACELVGEWGSYKIPLIFSTNGRAYLPQLAQESGIWLLDLRDTYQQRRVLEHWYSPEDLRAYLKQNQQQAADNLAAMPFQFDFSLRPYQIQAIQAVEQALAQQQRALLLAMATGTGKTKTCIALIYRLLKAERFRRILFLVDRSALGVQAFNAFHETRMENGSTFASTFDVLSLQDKYPDGDARCVQIATVQSMIKRVLFEPENRPSAGQYDCIVVDECHRGYLLDKLMDDTELELRDQNDYLSKYKQVLHYFDAVRIGLTATPAAHTATIFGEPVFTYSYPEAVIDGFLVDHLPPIRIQTQLAQDGIHYAVNETVQAYDVQRQQIVSYNTPDELEFDVAQFNRLVINENFNRAVIEYLIENELINPDQPAKTLVFCVTDDHADTVERLFKEVCAKHLGGIEDDAVMKITGSVYKPLEQILRYKNDRLPNIAITVDLLTTGIDVDRISNIVFLRQVNSRILYEQMLGRATRLCPEIHKGHFRIFDAVDLYSKLEQVNTMRPVVTDPTIPFTQLELEIVESAKPELIELARGQFLAKLQVKKNYLTDAQAEAFQLLTGQTPQALIPQLKALPTAELSQWFKQYHGIGDILDAKVQSQRAPIIISGHADQVIQVTEGYGDGRQRPEDYLQAFKQFINAQGNKLPALEMVITRPWSLTRADLKKLIVELERNHFREVELDAAWKATTNEAIVARIMGHIRQAALGDALIPWDKRVDQALGKILKQQDWNVGQRKWIQAIAGQTKAEIIVDMDSFHAPIFKNQGGLKKANILFDNNPQAILQRFNEALWREVG